MHAVVDSEKPHVAQTDTPLPARETLPTMYDLPSEDPEEPGLPDDFHYFQPQLLRETFVPDYPPERVYVATDLNLYYDVHHPLRHKRPDWFAVLGAPRLYEERDLRLSYVVWQEGVVPFIAVELLSPRTEAEDLGKNVPTPGEPPGKWEVYEQILQVPYYVLFSRYTDEFRAFELQGGHYRELSLDAKGLWLDRIKLGLALWRGEYQGMERTWLRWYDAAGQWLATRDEALSRQAQRIEREKQRTMQERQRAEQERQRAEQERQRAERLAAKLRELGVEPD